MKRFKDANDAMKSIRRSIKIIDFIERSVGQFSDHYKRLGRTVLWHLYNICEAALYVCCANDARTSGTITFPSLRDLPRFNSIPEMDIPFDIRNASKTANKYSIPDLENDINQNEFFDAIQAMKAVLTWICENTRVEDIRFALDDILRNPLFNTDFAL